MLVWQKGMQIAVAIITATRQMPRSELFGLTSQMRRAASSIPMNIAEGFGQHTRPKFIHGLRTAMGSLCELMTAYEIAIKAGYLRENADLLEALAEEDRMLQSLIRELDAKERATDTPGPARTRSQKPPR
ncbi:MAG: four helix bundle protein [Phycisphaerae bacterium]|nr:four helix bundle protein [Phycisphaerae bacterium]